MNTEEKEVGVIDCGALINLFELMKYVREHDRIAIFPQLMFLRDQIRKAEELLTEEQKDKLK